MHLTSLFARRRQDEFHTQRNIKGLTRTGSWAAFILACIAASALIFAAASQNIQFGWLLGRAHSELGAYTLASASLGASILGPFAFLGVSVAFRNRHLGQCLSALVLAVGCLAYSSVCSLGFTSKARSDAISERSAAGEPRALAKARFEAAKAELASLTGQSRRIVERRRELERTMREASSAVQVAPAIRNADPQASALSFYLGQAGWNVAAADVGVWLNAAMVLFLEVAAALSLTVAAALYPSTRQTGQEASRAAAASRGARSIQEDEKAASDAPTDSGDDDRDEPPAPRGRAGRKPTVLPEAAIAKLRAKGGHVKGSLNGIGRLIGTKSKTTAHRLLHQLAAAGQVRLTAGPNGVSVALA